MDFDDDVPADDPVPGRSQALAEDQSTDQMGRHLAVLEKLRDMGLDVAVAMKTRAIYAAAEGKTDDKAAKAFALIAKTVQQVILLHMEATGLREKRRTDLLARRKTQAKQIARRAIEREDLQSVVARTPQAEKERQVRRVKLDDLFRELDEDIFEGLSVAEVVERACKLFGVEPDKTLRWPEWDELRGETGAEAPVQPPAAAAKAKPAVPARFSGASALGLSGRAPPGPGFSQPRERAPP